MGTEIKTGFIFRVNSQSLFRLVERRFIFFPRQQNLAPHGKIIHPVRVYSHCIADGPDSFVKLILCKSDPGQQVQETIIVWRKAEGIACYLGCFCRVACFQVTDCQQVQSVGIVGIGAQVLT